MSGHDCGVKGMLRIADGNMFLCIIFFLECYLTKKMEDSCVDKNVGMKNEGDVKIDCWA